MPTHRHIQLVCFDIGGVLARCVTSWADACQRAGVPVVDEFYDQRRKQELISASARFEVGELDAAGFAQVICGCSKYEPAHVAAVLKEWIVEMYAGVDALLERLTSGASGGSGGGVRTALLSNTNEFHWSMLEGEERFAPLRRVPHRFASHLMRSRKPDPEAYEHVEHALGVPAESILFFDDRQENIAGAVWAHWQTELIDPLGDPAAQMETHLRRYGVL